MQEASRWVGRVLRDKWRIDARIARGGVGTVFAATHKNNGNRIAIKVLHPEFSRDRDTRSRFLQEGYAANQVNHPGVVRILDDDVTEEGLAFLVMELLEGELLEKRRIRKGGRLPQVEVYEIADQLLDVLSAAHEKGIVHRDIKPDNLFLTKEGRLKVLDFGFAQMKTGFRKEQTATGFLLGTPGFMSPEQAVGNRAQVDAATDIWAVGATLFTCLSGQPVHAGESAAEMLVAAANFPARPLLSVENTIPPKLAEIVDRALAFDKKQRWPSARAMQQALRNVPNRQPLQNFESGRRSVPAQGSFPPPPIPAAGRRPDDDATIAAESIEEVDPSTLSPQKPSWQTDQRTVIANPSRPLPKGAIPSERPPPFGKQVHPADEDMPTMAMVGPAADVEPMTAKPLTPMMPRNAAGSGPIAAMNMTRPITGSSPAVALPSSSGSMPPRFDGTMIMDSAPVAVHRPSSPSGSLPPAHLATPPKPFGAFNPGAEPAFAGPPGTKMGGGRNDEPLMFVAGPAQPAPPSPQGKKLLVFVAVAAISMIIVVVTGLLVIAASD